MDTENAYRRAAPDLEKEALTIAAHTMQRAAEELRQELRQANKQITELQAERSRLLRELQAITPPQEREILDKYQRATQEVEEHLDYLRATHQLQSFGYWRKRRKELQRQEQEQQQRKSA
jgi:hypothetical protein